MFIITRTLQTQAFDASIIVWLYDLCHGTNISCASCTKHDQMGSFPPFFAQLACILMFVDLLWTHFNIFYILPILWSQKRHTAPDVMLYQSEYHGIITALDWLHIVCLMQYLKHFWAPGHVVDSHWANHQGKPPIPFLLCCTPACGPQNCTDIWDYTIARAESRHLSLLNSYGWWILAL